MKTAEVAYALDMVENQDKASLYQLATATSILVAALLGEVSRLHARLTQVEELLNQRAYNAVPTAVGGFVAEGGLREAAPDPTDE